MRTSFFSPRVLGSETRKHREGELLELQVSRETCKPWLKLGAVGRVMEVSENILLVKFPGGGPDWVSPQFLDLPGTLARKEEKGKLSPEQEMEKLRQKFGLKGA